MNDRPQASNSDRFHFPLFEVEGCGVVVGLDDDGEVWQWETEFGSEVL